MPPELGRKCAPIDGFIANVTDVSSVQQVDLFLRPPLLTGEYFTDAIVGPVTPNDDPSMESAGAKRIVTIGMVSYTATSSVVRVTVSTAGEQAVGSAEGILDSTVERIRSYHRVVEDPEALRLLREQFRNNPLW